MKIKNWQKFLLLFAALLHFSSCTLVDDISTDAPQEGQIYFRWTQDLSNPGYGGWCDLISGNFKDNNNAVPDFANENTYYGPCKPGTYQAQFNFDITGSKETLQTFSYTLEKPEKGYVRYYSKQLREYYPDLNRCVNVSRELTTLTFIDVKL